MVAEDDQVGRGARVGRSGGSTGHRLQVVPPSVVFHRPPPVAPNQYSSGRARLPATACERPAAVQPDVAPAQPRQRERVRVRGRAFVRGSACVGALVPGAGCRVTRAESSCACAGVARSARARIADAERAGYGRMRGG